MVTVKISENTYDYLRKLVADYLSNEMINGVVQEWDDLNNKAVQALVELNKIS